MFGLLFTSALGVGIVAAWPLYLHLRRRRNMRVQAVPSLRLFGFTKRKTRRIRIRQLLLLIMRLAFILTLSLLLAQPFLSSSTNMPLPPIAGEQDDETVAAIIIDDSVSSMHGKDGVTRMQQSKEVLAKTITYLPKGTSISFTVTTSPFPTPRMTGPEALLFLKRLQSIPKQGNAVSALRNTLKRFSGKPTALIGCAPLNRRLWEDADELFEHKGNVPLRLLDLPSLTTPAYIVGVRNNVLRVGGETEVLKGSLLTVKAHDGQSLISRPLTTHEALLGEVILDLTVQTSPFYTATLGDGTHPWQTYYFQAGRVDSTGDQVVIIRTPTPEALLLDQLFTGVILAFHDQASITHYNPQENQSLPQASTLIIIGQPSLNTTLQPWIKQCIESGVRILAVPTTEKVTTENRMVALPIWGNSIEPIATDFPITLDPSADLPIDELTVLEVRTLRPKTIISPFFSEGASVALRAGGHPILVRKQLEANSVCWALGVPLNTKSNSISWHPAFPVLINHLLFPPKVRKREHQLTVGSIIRANEWFDVADGTAELLTPSKRKQTVRISGNNSDSITLDEAGGYQLSHKSGQIHRVSNLLREQENAILKRKDLEANLKGCRIHWADNALTLNADAFNKLTDQGETNRSSETKKLDLSPVVFWALLIFFIVESLLLYFSWRQRASISA